jgi:hypothetical protein
MVVRGAKYPRKENEFYATPAETTRVVLDLVDFDLCVCDPAAGNGAIMKVLKEYRYIADGADLGGGYDFLKDPWQWPGRNILTNPPFGIGGRTAMEFIERALVITRPYQGKVAMLLPIDFDSGATRSHVFGFCPAFALKIVLLNRIRWFNGVSGSTNHAWFVWDWTHEGPPIIRYAKQIYSEHPLT